MAVVWNPWALPWAIALLVSWSAAAIVLWVAPTRRQNRWLAVLLFTEGGGAFGALIGWTTQGELAHAGVVLQTLAAAAFLPSYLVFLSTLDTPMSRFMRRRAIRWPLVTLVLLYPVFCLLLSYRYVVGVAPDPGEAIGWSVAFGPWFNLQYYPATFDYAAGLVVTLTAYYLAKPGTIAKERATAYAAAFLLYDGFWLGDNLVNTILVASGHPPTPTANAIVFLVAAPVIDCVWVCLLAYGILRTQLFDIDLRLKVAFRRSTLAACFAAAFFVGGNALQELIPVQGFLLGLVAAGAVALALRPLERAAARVADRLFPDGTRDYIDGRKLDVYRAALETAHEDGTLTPEEAALLARLRAKLNIDEALAASVEADVRGGTAAGT